MGSISSRPVLAVATQWRTVVFALTCSLVLAACSSASPSPGESAPASNAPAATPTPAVAEHPDVTVRLQTDWGGPIDPAQTANAAGTGQLVLAAYDTLTAISPTGEILPYLAESWDTTPTSVTFTLKDGVTCSDGTPVTATVVADSLRNVAENSSRASTAFGAGPYTIEGDDAARTVTFSVEAPNNELVYGFHWYFTGIVCPAGRQADTDFENNSYGSGPFVLQSVNSGVEAVFQRRSDWTWGPQGWTAADNGVPETITFQVVANESTAANLLATGGLDFGLITGPDLARLSNEASLSETTDYSFVAWAMVFNEDPTHVTSDTAVRQALMTAVDPASFNQAALDGTGQVTTSFFISTGNCYDPATANLVPSPAGDTSGARDILIADGYTVGSDGKLEKGGEQLTVTVIGFDGQNAGPEYLASQFDEMGANAVLNLTDNATWVANQKSGDFDVLVPTFANSAPVAAFVPPFFNDPFPPDGLNRTRTNDPELNDLLAEARSAPLGQQCPAWEQYQERLLTEHHMLPLAAPAYSFFAPSGYGRLLTDGPLFFPASIRSE